MYFYQDPANPEWVRDEGIGNGEVTSLDPDEQHFWQRCLKKYLKPLRKDEKHEERITNVSNVPE